MDWCVAIRRIGERKAALVADLRTNLELLDHEDVLVTYTAKEALRDLLGRDEIEEELDVNEAVEAIMTVSSGGWRREGSGFRFQLLRQLLKTEVEQRDNMEEDDLSQRYLEALLKNVKRLEIMVCGAFGLVDHSVSAPYSVQYEAIVFMSDFTKSVHELEIAEASRIVELSDLMDMLMNNVLMMMDYASQPRFVSCAVLGLLGNFQDTMACWREQGQDAGNEGTEAIHLKWLDLCVMWITQSSCRSEAARMLNSTEPANAASQEAFIGRSKRYPFLQQWLLYLSYTGVALSETVLAKSRKFSWDGVQLPRRQQLFAVLSEQDDVMIEVVNGLTRVADAGTETLNNLCQLLAWPSSFREHCASEYDPDLLFADFVETLGQDHLVLLDLLVSSETKMLEYIMRYLRHLSKCWSASKQMLQFHDRLGGVMSVLIRLRLEVDRLVAADLFPYRAGPLTRRLLAIEQLYEEPSDDAENV